MTIQDISVSNNQKKKILRDITDADIIFQDDNGDLVIQVAAYQTWQQETGQSPLQNILGDDMLDFSAEYFVFS